MKVSVAAYLKILSRLVLPPILCTECVVEGRSGKAQTLGLCHRHYQRLRRYGNPSIKPKTGSAWI